MKKSYHKNLNPKLCDILPDFDLIEFKIYKPFPLKLKKKPPENVCSIFFANKGVS